jgi:hypothetical protein
MLAYGFLLLGAFWALLAVVFLGNDVAYGKTGEWDSLSLAFVFWFSVLAMPSLIAGWGLLRVKRWARLFAIIMAVVAVPIFPIGTAFGLYALWVLFSDSAKILFSPTQSN